MDKKELLQEMRYLVFCIIHDYMKLEDAFHRRDAISLEKPDEISFYFISRYQDLLVAAVNKLEQLKKNEFTKNLEVSFLDKESEND